jgi:hypothetical protein
MGILSYVEIVLVRKRQRTGIVDSYPLETYHASESSTYPLHIDTLSESSRAPACAGLQSLSLGSPPSSDNQIISAIFKGQVITI